MGKSCAVIPQVLNKNGNKVDSRLFKDLLSFLTNSAKIATNKVREEAVRLYQIIKSDEFKNKFHSKLSFDDANEPTIRSLFKETNLKDYVGVNAILDKLKRDIGHYKRNQKSPVLLPKNRENYEKLSDKAREFNTNSEYRDEYVADIITLTDEQTGKEGYGISIFVKDKYNAAKVEQREYNENLNNKLRSILRAKGVSIGALTELEKRLGINGVTDFDMARTEAEGLIELIRLAEGIEGEKVLPEEFAHFAIEAMGSDNPLINRLINLIIDKNLAPEIIGEEYEHYRDEYNNNTIKLAKEAAGKLLAKHLLQSVEIPAKPYKNLLQRVISSIKNFFQGLLASDIQRAMIQADKAFGNLARDILEGNLDDQIKVSNITKGDKYFNLTERVARDKKLLQDIIDTELKRYKIYTARTDSTTFDATQRAFIESLKENLEKNNELLGIHEFLDKVLSVLPALESKLNSLNNSGSTMQSKASILRDVRNYIYSYKGILAEVRKALLEEKQFSDNRYEDKTKESLDRANTLLSDIETMYSRAAIPLFVSFIKPFLGENLVVPFGKWKGQVITAEELIHTAYKDISFFDRWLDSMADSSSYMLKIMDQAVKKAKENARLDTIELSHEIKRAAAELEAAGIRTTEWMFERDRNGNITGRYISERDYSKFLEAKKAFFKALKEKYGDFPTGNDATAYNEEVKAWYKANTEKVKGEQVPKKSIYENKQFTNLNDAQRKYYNTIMEIKDKLDSYLPEHYTHKYNTIKIRKDLIERVKDSKSANPIWESIKDQFIRRSDDTEFGVKCAVKDFEENEVQLLPVYYTKVRNGESENDMSTDVTSTLIAYAAMANDFKEMNKIIDILEVGRDMLRDNLQPQETKGNKPLIEKINVLGETVESKFTKKKGTSRILQRLDDFFEMQVYGRYIADEGTWGKIDKAKLANFIIRQTALNSLALNVMSGISNVATGKVMMRIESMAKEFFSERDTIEADKNYATSMPEFLAEFGSRIKVSKIALWGELFNVMQEYEKDIKETDWYKRGITRANSSALFFMNNAGEHWMQFRTSMALANRYKMKAPDGKIVSLWDAMEVRYKDPNNKKLGAELVVKEGYTKEDGTQFTRNDIIKFSRKSAAVNQRLHGIYNQLDKNALQKVAIGRMGMLFRKWIKPSLNRRFAEVGYNFDLEEWTEGYYRTSFRFLGQLAKELKEGQFSVAANWENLTSTEKANIKRALTELAHFLAVVAILGLIDWPDDKDRPWLSAMTEYQLRRLYTELGAMVPGPQMISEGFKILKSPSATIRTMESSLDLIGLLNPYNYEFINGEEALLRSGRFKGDSRAIKLFYESPLIPMNKTIYRGLHPEELLPFFKN